MPRPILNKTTFVKFSRFSLWCFSCWNCIKAGSSRKVVTCPSNQRTAVCECDLRAGAEGLELASHTDTLLHAF